MKTLSIGSRICRVVLGAGLMCCGLAFAPAAWAQGGDVNACDAIGDYPDVIVGDLYEIAKNGTVGSISAISSSIAERVSVWRRRFSSSSSIFWSSKMNQSFSLPSGR